jgi:hypothetical protein
MLEATRLTIAVTCSRSSRWPDAAAGTPRRWRAAIAHEGGLLRHGQVHARALHLAQARDRARELGLQRVLVAGVLHELADAEARVLLHQREAARSGQPLRGQPMPRIVDALAGTMTAPCLDLVRDAVLLQRLHSWAASASPRLPNSRL